MVAKELEREPPPGETKSHVYIFDKAEDWAQFQTMGQLEQWTGGIHSAGSLFIKRDPRSRFAGNTLGHEIAHLIMHRFFSDHGATGTMDRRHSFGRKSFHQTRSA